MIREGSRRGADDLNAPLGQNAKQAERSASVAHRRRRSPGCSACSVVVFVLWALIVRRSARRRAVAWSRPISPQPDAGGSATAQAGSETPGDETMPAASRRRPPPPTHRRRPARKTITIIDGSTGKRQEVPIPARRSDSRAAPAERACSRPRGTAPIPKIAPDGARPAEVYARPQRRRQAGRAADRDRGRRARRQRERHGDALRQAARPGDACVHALRRRYRASGRRAPAARATRCCCRFRWSRTTIPTTIRVRRRC